MVTLSAVALPETVTPAPLVAFPLTLPLVTLPDRLTPGPDVAFPLMLPLAFPLMSTPAPVPVALPDTLAPLLLARLPVIST
ncbi:MAG: hypothetical protein RR402_01550, partial [Citrobacter sp.]